jgi:hypothetical protein
LSLDLRTFANGARLASFDLITSFGRHGVDALERRRCGHPWGIDPSAWDMSSGISII